MAIALPQGKQYFEATGGGPAVGYKLFTYIPGTSTPKDTYTTSVGNVANTNPVVMDARGEAAIYWVGTYDVVLKNVAGAVVWGPERLDATFNDLRADLADPTSAANGAALVGLARPDNGGTARTVRAFLLEQEISPLDFGALWDGTGRTPTDDGVNISAASWNNWPSWVTNATYLTKPGHDYGNGAFLAANKPFSNTDSWDFIGTQLAMWAATVGGKAQVLCPGGMCKLTKALRWTGSMFVDLVGSHSYQSRIVPKDDSIFPLLTGVGAPTLYLYRMGLSGVRIRNLGLSTYDQSGPNPAFSGDPIASGNGWGSGTEGSCAIAAINCDTVTISECLLSGIGPCGIYADSVSNIVCRDISLEYYTNCFVVKGGSTVELFDCTMFNSLGTAQSAVLATGVYMNNSEVRISRGNITAMRGWSVIARSATSAVSNTLVMTDAIKSYTDTDGQCLNLQYMKRILVDGCDWQFGVPTQPPFIMLDKDGTALPLATTGLGYQFINNTVSNIGGNSTHGFARVNGDGWLMEGNTFAFNSDGSAENNFWLHSLNGVSYTNGTTNFRFRNNWMPVLDMAKTSIIGDVYSGNRDFFGSDKQGGGISRAAIASAAALTLPRFGDGFFISGTTTITSIVATGNEGRVVTLVFQGALTFTDGSNLILAGNFVTTADDAITLYCSGTNWYERSRSVN